MSWAWLWSWTNLFFRSLVLVSFIVKELSVCLFVHWEPYHELLSLCYDGVLGKTLVMSRRRSIRASLDTKPTLFDHNELRCFLKLLIKARLICFYDVLLRGTLACINTLLCPLFWDIINDHVPRTVVDSFRTIYIHMYTSTPQVQLWWITRPPPPFNGNR